MKGSPIDERIIKINHDDDDENDDHDDDKIIDDNEVNKALDKIKDFFYKRLYVQHYENQNLLDISIRTEIHKHFDTYKDYKLLDR